MMEVLQTLASALRDGFAVIRGEFVGVLLVISVVLLVNRVVKQAGKE